MVSSNDTQVTISITGLSSSLVYPSVGMTSAYCVWWNILQDMLMKLHKALFACSWGCCTIIMSCSTLCFFVEICVSIWVYKTDHKKYNGFAMFFQVCILIWCVIFDFAWLNPDNARVFRPKAEYLPGIPEAENTSRLSTTFSQVVFEAVLWWRFSVVYCSTSSYLRCHFCNWYVEKCSVVTDALFMSLQKLSWSRFRCPKH